MSTQRILTDRGHPLFDTKGTRAIEVAAQAVLPSHALMQRAGLAIARLAMAVAPHARTIWIACGPGNNGGDGMEAAMHLTRSGKDVVITWLGDESRAPADARASLQRARGAGVRFMPQPPDEMSEHDLCIDALLGIGGKRPPDAAMQWWIDGMNRSQAQVLAVDMPTGLHADIGASLAVTPAQAVRAQHTLSLLTLKPGLFTAQGRDYAGQVWLDNLGCSISDADPVAWLSGPPSAHLRPHASHKGSYGDVAVIGGAPGMTGAALLAASAALHRGAGRVFVALLDQAKRGSGRSAGMSVDPAQPELMFRPVDGLDLALATVVCGCGGGEAVAAVLPAILKEAPRLVLDADALNAIATDVKLQRALAQRSKRGQPTVLTPHPLEAARLLGKRTNEVQADRLSAANTLANRFGSVVVLKGSGSVIAAPGRPAHINPTGNALLATGGTGDVLAGMIGARLAAGNETFTAACAAVFNHGLIADRWPPGTAFTAGLLARTG
jgi:hydroxyethylthiazole kinase-like uncharacterized protein yjeF